MIKKRARAGEISLNKLDIISGHAAPFLIVASVILVAKDFFIQGIILSCITLLIIGRLPNKLIPDKAAYASITPLSIRLKRKDKQAWLMILEVFIAIMLLMGIFLVLIEKQNSKPDISEEMYKIERQILLEASENNTIRSAVLSNSASPHNPASRYAIESFVYGRLSPVFDYNISVCEIFEPCELEQKVRGDVYADDILIASNLTYSPLQPLILRLFLWAGTPHLPVAPPAGGLPPTICVESWICTGWSPDVCPPSQIQARTCTDENNCGTTVNKPTEQQSCEYVAPTCPEGWKCINFDTRKYQKTDCSYDETKTQLKASQPCAKTAGVCAGSTKTCSGTGWVDCSDADYTTWANRNGLCTKTGYADYNCYNSVESRAPLCIDGSDNNCNGYINSETYDNC